MTAPLQAGTGQFGSLTAGEGAELAGRVLSVSLELRLLREDGSEGESASPACCAHLSGRKPNHAEAAVRRIPGDISLQLMVI